MGGPSAARRVFSPRLASPLTGPRGTPAAGDSRSRQHLAPISRSVQFTPHPWAPKPRTPVALFPLGNLSRLSLPPHPSRHKHITQYIHNITCVPMNMHCKSFTRTLSLVYAHAVKRFTPQQASETYSDLHKTWTHLHTHIVTQVCTHSCTLRHTVYMHALPTALAVRKHALLGAHGLARSRMLGQAGRQRKPSEWGGHRLRP